MQTKEAAARLDIPFVETICLDIFLIFFSIFLFLRAKRISREVGQYWRKFEKEQRDAKKIAEKMEIERIKREEEVREAKRQQKKLNFLLTQTELFSHFISRKIQNDGPTLEQQKMIVVPQGEAATSGLILFLLSCFLSLLTIKKQRRSKKMSSFRRLRNERLSWLMRNMWRRCPTLMRASKNKDRRIWWRFFFFN